MSPILPESIHYFIISLLFSSGTLSSNLKVSPLPLPLSKINGGCRPLSFSYMERRMVAVRYSAC